MACIEILCGTDGVSGNETPVKNYIKKELGDIKTRSDSIGNLYAYLDGKSPDKTVLVTTHIDEAGFIISKITDEGFLKFKTVGEIDPRTIVSKKLRIGENGIKGIIGMKAIHLQQKSERENTAKIKNLFIDIGAKSKKKALKSVSVGDYAAFDTEIERFGSFYKGKAMDRACALCAIRAAKTAKPLYNTIFVFTAQRHSGSRGAHSVKEAADIAINIGTVPSPDMFGAKPYERTVRLGGGACIGYGDRYSVPAQKFCDTLYAMAKNNGIAVQRTADDKNAGIAGAVQTGFGGRLTAGIDIPVRYQNTPASLVSPEDINSGTEILKSVLENAGEYLNRGIL